MKDFLNRPRLTQSLVAIAGNDFCREGSGRVFAQMLYELLGFGDFTALGAGLLGGGDVAQVALKCSLKRHAFGAAAQDVHTSDHFVFGASRPVLSITLGAEGFSHGRPASFANQCLPGAGRCFDECCHERVLLGGWRTSTVPNLYPWSVGL